MQTEGSRLCTQSLPLGRELGCTTHSALPAHEASCLAPSPGQPARAGHTSLCDVGSRHAVVGAGRALLGWVRTYLWCHLSCSDK